MLRGPEKNDAFEPSFLFRCACRRPNNKMDVASLALTIHASVQQQQQQQQAFHGDETPSNKNS